MQGDRAGADRDGGVEHGQAVAAARCARRSWPAWIAPLALSIGDDVGQHVVGDGQQQQVAGARDGGGLVAGDAGQQGRDAVAGGVGLAGGGDDLVAGGAQRGGEDGTDATGADDADLAGRWRHVSNLSFQSRRPPLPRVREGPVWVPDDVLGLFGDEPTLHRAAGNGREK